jgi:hypothetical protein
MNVGTIPVGSVALADRGGRETGAVTSSGSSSVFAGFRFPREVIAVAVRWYLRYGLSYRDVEELLAERGVTVDRVAVYRWVQRFPPQFIEAARLCRHAPGNRWFADDDSAHDRRSLKPLRQDGSSGNQAGCGHCPKVSGPMRRGIRFSAGWSRSGRMLIAAA